MNTTEKFLTEKLTNYKPYCRSHIIANTSVCSRLIAYQRKPKIQTHSLSCRLVSECGSINSYQICIFRIHQGNKSYSQRKPALASTLLIIIHINSYYFTFTIALIPYQNQDLILNNSKVPPQHIRIDDIKKLYV